MTKTKKLRIGSNKQQFGDAVEDTATTDPADDQLETGQPENLENQIDGKEGYEEDDVEDDAAADKKRKRKRKRKAGADADPGASAAGGATAAAAVGAVKENAFVNSQTLYIEGLPFSASEDDVRRFFQDYGKVVSVRLPRWHDSGRLRGYGHVEFSTSEAAQKSYELDGCDFLDSGRYLKIAPPMCPRALQKPTVVTSASGAAAASTGANVVIKPDGCKCVFVKNLPYDVTEEAIKDAFKICGPVTNVRLAVWGHTQQLKGFGYVEFKRDDSAEIAVKKSGSLSVNGRPLLIDFETGAPKGSFKPKKA
jgi:nucleolin